MRRKILAISLVAIVASAVLFPAVALADGCDQKPDCDKKFTGGGWFESCNGNFVTFGFNAQPLGNGNAKGQFQLVDHSTKTRVHAVITAVGDCYDDVGVFTGTARINGEDGNTFIAYFYDGGEPGPPNGDWLAATADGLTWVGDPTGGGNIQRHDN